MAFNNSSHMSMGKGRGKTSLLPEVRAQPDWSCPSWILLPSAKPLLLVMNSAAAGLYLGVYSKGHLCLEAGIDPNLFDFLQNQRDPAVLDRMMKKLDLNSDGQLDFQEFLNLIGGIAVACHDALLVQAPNH